MKQLKLLFAVLLFTIAISFAQSGSDGTLDPNLPPPGPPPPPCEVCCDGTLYVIPDPFGILKPIVICL